VIRKPPLTIGLGALLLVLAACRPGRVLVTPAPERIESLEGYASLRITERGETSRSKFSFLLVLPHRGRIEASNFLVGSVYQMIFTPNGASFVVPSKRVYWEGKEEEVIYRFLGFHLSLDEVIRLFSGRWPDAAPEGWRLRKDARGRILSGSRGDLSFSVEDFAEGSSIPASIAYRYAGGEGRLRMLRIAFNRTPSDRAFSLDFKRRFQRKTWEEIFELIHDPD